ncbi:MAG: tRNA epoxyqueuosine(34) reductase QueG [Flavobacteriales bacterium]|nr:tRNA epoxyqueuosine(34) reductase QueG [Flavobacteriales bacterium]
MNNEKHTQLIKKKAFELGFSHVGISKASFLEDEARKLEIWLKNNHHGKMKYMENYFDLRTDPRKLVDDAKSVVTVLINYNTDNVQKDKTVPKISKYAYGKDYHFIIREKLNALYDYIKLQIGEVNARGFVDSAPVMDKVWAKKSGLGWLGKNSNIINRETGSFFFIGELILDLELDTDVPIKDYCGTCTKCIDACPTDAIVEPYVVDGSKCISYLTIELKDELIPDEFKGKMDDWIFGCDVCQDVCPWNRFSKPHNEEWFDPHVDLLSLTKTDWEELNIETFNKVFKKSAVKRTKYEGLKRNIKFINTKKG